MTNSRIRISGVGYSAASILFQRGTFSNLIRGLQCRLKGLQGLLVSEDRAEGEGENANSTDTQDDADYTFNDRPLTLLQIIRDDSDHMPNSWDHENNLLEKRLKLRKALQGDTDHADDSWEHFMHNFIVMPYQIREALQDDSSEDFVDILKAWKPKYKQERAHFFRDKDDESIKDEVVTDDDESMKDGVVIDDDESKKDGVVTDVEISLSKLLNRFFETLSENLLESPVSKIPKHK